MADVEHTQKFGGQWSILKVEAVEKYLKAFVTVMTHQPYDLVYIDTFAGSGSFTFGEDVPAIPTLEADRNYSGSVKRALAIAAFKELYFMENDPRNLASLRAIAGHDRRATIVAGDANVELAKLCHRLEWRRRRGVIFVDPYGPDTNWDMLRAIASTKALDMFWLFPLSAVYRNAPRKHSDLTADKKDVVSRSLGNDDWETHFYSEDSAAMADLFDNAPTRLVRHVDVGRIEAYVTAKLKSIFPHVEKPARLLGPSSAPLFNLYFAVSNPSPAAIRRAGPIARHLLNAI